MYPRSCCAASHRRCIHRKWWKQGAGRYCRRLLVAISGVQEKINARNRELEQSRIADMTEINRFWSDTMRNAKYDIKDRLKASELRARAAGGFVDKGEHSVELKVKNPFAELTTEELRRLAGDE